MFFRLMAMLTIAAHLTLTACGPMLGGEAMGPKEQAGLVAGGVSGAVLGGAIAGYGGGVDQAAWAAGLAILGALLGSRVGAYLDEQDKIMAQRALLQAQSGPVGQAATWHNPESGHSGRAIAQREGFHANGAYCREIRQDVVLGREMGSVTNMLCRSPDGTWTAVN